MSDAAAPTLSFVPGEAGEAKATLGSEQERADAIKRQVEFYFSEQNLGKDKFLRAEMTKTAPENWVDISVLSSFNRMKVILPSGDVAEVAAALKGSEVVEVSPCGKKVRRFPHLLKKEVTLGGKKFTSRSEVISHARPMLEKGGELSEEDATFVKDLLSHHANAATKVGPGIKSIKAGCNPKWPDTKCFVLSRTDGTEDDFSYIKCVNLLFPLEVEPSAGRVTRGMKRKAEADLDDPVAKRGPGEPTYTKGTILVIKGLVEGNDIGSLKDKFNTVTSAGAVKFVELVEGQPLAYVRFSTPESAAKALEAKPEGVGELSLLEGDDEKAYWDKIGSSVGRGGGNKGRGGKGGKGRGRGRGRGRR